MLSALILAALLAKGGTYANPVLYADYSDPDIIRAGKAYYLVSSSFHFSPGIPVLKSLDLVHWKIVGHVLPKLPFSPDYDMVPPFVLTDAVSKPVGPGLKYAEGVWAPSIRYHAGRFYVFWPTPKEGIFMASAATPEGPWTAPVQVIAGPNYEDPCPFWDDDGQAWLIHGKVGAGPLILHRMSVDGTHVLDDGQIVVNDPKNLPTLEGPKLYKRDGYYYIFAPFGGVGEGAQVVLRSKDIHGPYDWKVVLSKGDTAVQGPHQGGYVETPSGQGWFVHFNSTGAFGRIDYLEPVAWQDGWPVMGDDGHPVATHAAPDTGAWTRDRLQDSDEFSAPKLGLQWEWNHNPDDTKWSLSERPGYLRLHAGLAEHLVTARNTLTQILQGPHAVFTTRIDLSHMTDGQRAGLTLFGVKPVWIGAVRDQGQTHVTFASAGIETPGPAIGKTIVLRAEVTADQVVRFGYSADGKRFTPLGEPTPLAKFSWWKGSRPGLFTYAQGQGEGGYVDIDWFRVRHLEK